MSNGELHAKAAVAYDAMVTTATRMEFQNGSASKLDYAIAGGDPRLDAGSQRSCVRSVLGSKSETQRFRVCSKLGAILQSIK